ncbi:MAG TPA: hypothetical protein VIY26_17055 [Acidimicrobiales bacterium]
MPSDRTTVTELGTGLGMLGLGSIDESVRSRSSVMHSISPEMWERLARLRSGGLYEAEFHAAWENGRAFLAAADGLRERLPLVVEWKGTGRAPGDEVAPIDLRVDHVYLVSCKYLSDILFNVSPAHVFDNLLIAGQSRGSRATREVLPGGGDWYAEVAPVEYQALYESVKHAVHRGDAPIRSGSPRSASAARAGRAGSAASLPGLEATDPSSAARPTDHSGSPDLASQLNGKGVSPDALEALPHRAVDLTTAQREALGRWLRPGWPTGAKELYFNLSDAVARVSVRRWEASMEKGGGTGEALLWRLLRIGSAPYFVLGSSSERLLRLRIATSWDWRQQFQLVAIDLEPQRGGQPRVGWHAVVRDRTRSETVEITGHIEVRWSHGRFGGLPEAKGYLDTPHHQVPGYFALR